MPVPMVPTMGSGQAAYTEAYAGPPEMPGVSRCSLKDRLRSRAAAYREQANTLDRLCAVLPDDLPPDVEDVLHRVVLLQ